MNTKEMPTCHSQSHSQSWTSAPVIRLNGEAGRKDKAGSNAHAKTLNEEQLPVLLCVDDGEQEDPATDQPSRVGMREESSLHRYVDE
jgi:hypothetical protein